ncbi:MAG: crossover junction endodeoxyribonuclease RuvC [Syntrophobacteraceae bacterium]|nr:crossover junction endodeoxyribonuclease RuvC [Syntrophobacteraceae bacterium]
MIRTIGVDPGSRYTGFGIVEGDGSHLKHIHHGTVKIASSRPLPERLEIIFEQLKDSIGAYGPQFMAIEEVFFAKNVKSALTLGQARGVAILAGVGSGLSIHEYSALRIKQSVAGYGRAAKEQVAGMVQRLLRIDKELEPDAADALAVAVCHISTWSSNLRWKVPQRQ